MKFKTIALALACVGFLFATTGCKDKSPKGVCEKFYDLAMEDEKMKERMGDEKKDEVLKECEKEFEEIKKEAGDEKWEKFASCVHEASSFGDMKKCEPED